MLPVLLLDANYCLLWGIAGIASLPQTANAQSNVSGCADVRPGATWFPANFFELRSRGRGGCGEVGPDAGVLARTTIFDEECSRTGNTIVDNDNACVVASH